jgi:hypothetical protein
MYLSLALGILLASMACGGGSKAAPQSGTLSGNWQVTLERHVNPVPPLIFTGFVTQSGNSLAGNFILGSKCLGVGPLTGTLNDSNLSLTIDEFGEQISLEGAVSPLGGEFSNLTGGCTAFANTGVWTAVQVAPLTGSFHGTFTSSKGNGVLNVSGTLAQGPNTGASTATLSGNLAVTGPGSFCSYLSTATISGLISGTTVALNLYGPDGAEITQIGQVGQINNPSVVPSPGVCGANTPKNSNPCLLVAQDATSLSGNYAFPFISSSCTGDVGTIQLTLP